MNIFSQLNSVLQRPFADAEPEAAPTTTQNMPLPPSSSAPAAYTPRIPGLQLLAEWKQEHLKTINQVSEPTSKRQKTSSAASIRSSLPSKPQGAFAAKLNDLTQIYRLRTDFSYEEGPPQAFFVRLALMDLNQEVVAFQTSTACSSKKAAKEEVARQATDWLEQRDAPKKTQQRTGELEIGTIDKSEDWTSLLNIFCLQTHVTLPDYTFYIIGPERFAATCTISGQLYGDESVGHTSKKNAKAAAAHAAVLKLREGGVLGRRSSHILTSAPSVTSSSSSTTSTDRTSLIAASSSTASATSLIPPLCNTLSLTPPTYRFTSEKEGTAFVSVAAYFSDTLEPALRGPVGAVEMVFGKKNAKDQCAKLVLGVLERIKQQRLAA